MSDLKLAIFDVDGTLVDSQNLIVASMSAAFESVGAELPERATLLSVVGLSLPTLFAKLVPDVDLETQAIMVAAYKTAYHRIRTQDRSVSAFYEGGREVLDFLAGQDETLLGIATGKARRGVDHLLELHGLEGYFQTVQTADHHPSKPHASMVLTALAKTGVQAGNAVMIGDTTFDMDMARAADVPAIGVGWGYHAPEHLAASGARIVLDDFGQLAPFLDEFWGR